jgi:hypothetical protein
MAEMRMSSVIVGGLVIGAVGLVGAALMDWVNLPIFNKKTLLGWLDQGTAQVTGFTPAKTPQEAMDKFREAIDARKYKTAATYCTKSYADMLERSAVGAAELGAAIDAIQDFSKNKQLFTDKTTFFFFRLDPFPRVLKSGPAPVEKGGKTLGTYVWEEPKITPSALPNLAQEVRGMDEKMFQFFLAPEVVFKNPIEIVKEGDVWKLNIQILPVQDALAAHFNDNWKTYHTGLDSFRGSMMNSRFDTPAAFEQEVVEKLRGAKKPR